MRVLVVIPCYRVAEYLPSLIERIRAYQSDILVVDDGSEDDTADIALRAAANLISHPYNLGKGAALKSGFGYAMDNGYDFVITLDGDGQHDPKYIPDFIRKFELTGADIIIGSRSQNKADMPWDRRISNRLTSGLLAFLLGLKLEESQSGYRLVTTKLLKSIDLNSARFELETEIIIKAVKRGFKVEFVPISVFYGQNFPTSMHRLNDSLRWLKTVLEEI